MKSIVYRFTQLLLIIIIVISGVKVYKYKLNLKETDTIINHANNILKSSHIETNKNSVNFKKPIDESKAIKALTDKEVSNNIIKQLQDKYVDTVAYINIENTEISYPIVKAEDNDYYLSRSPNKDWNPNGSIFLDYQNNSNFSDDNTIIYGHNIKTGKLFNQLHKFKKQEFYDKTNTVDIHTKVGLKVYKIFSVYVTDPSFDYRQRNYRDLNEKYDFIEEVIDKSVIKPNLSSNLIYNETSKIITLSTCETGGAKRLVVHAVEIVQ